MYILWYLHYILTFFGAIGTNEWITKFRPLLFRGATWNRLAAGYWCCGTVCQFSSSVPSSVVKQSKKAAWTLKMGLTNCSEMLVTSCKSIPCNIPEQQRPTLQHGRSWTSWIMKCLPYCYLYCNLGITGVNI